MDTFTPRDYSAQHNDLLTANREVCKRAGYPCGVQRDSDTLTPSRNKFFFLSPDGQDGQLYYALKHLGYQDGGYSAPYYWKLEKKGVRISYTEGDITITQIKKAQ